MRGPASMKKLGSNRSHAESADLLGYLIDHRVENRRSLFVAVQDATLDFRKIFRMQIREQAALVEQQPLDFLCRVPSGETKVHKLRSRHSTGTFRRKSAFFARVCYVDHPAGLMGGNRYSASQMRDDQA